MMEPSSANTEEELERFREQWRREVNARNRRPETRPAENGKQSRRKEQAPVPSASLRPREVRDFSEDVEPRAYHDLPNKEDQLRLGEEGQNYDRDVTKEPKTALEHYERAVDKETTGQLGDSLRHYRTAFKLDDGVHEAYKRKHFPPSSFKPKPANPYPSNAPVTVPNTAHHSLHGSSSGGGLSASVKQMINDFSSLRIEPNPPPTSASPPAPSPLASLPEEILTQILTLVALADVAAFARLAQVCKRLAFLILTEEAPWKAVALGDEHGFKAMHYDFACDIEGFSAETNDSIARYLDSYGEDDPDAVELPPTPEDRAVAFSALTEQLLHSTYASSWRQMFRARPRIRFNGCYISTVNYTRPGATSTNTLTWGTPVHVVTYYRYLRFFRDGTAISLLTTSEPADVVHHLTKENLGQPAHSTSTLPSAVMKGALHGRWRLTGSASSSSTPEEPEAEGDLHVETEGVVPRLTYKLLLTLAHAGKGARNNKLAWKGFWSYNRLTDDWGEFGLRNDRAFYWSRVKSYGSGL